MPASCTVCEPRDLLDRQLLARAVADVGERDEQRLLVDLGLDGTSRRIVTPAQRGALVCVEVDDPAAAVELLQKQGVVTSWRDNSVRFSFHFYNDERDVQAALAALETV